MQPLSIQVHNLLPSSSQTPQELLPRKSGSAGDDNYDTYEVVNYNDIFFPDFRHIKRLGRGSYGTVVQCFFRGRPAAAKLVENSSTDHSQIRTEAELLHGFRHKNIIKLYALFHGEMSGLVLELMEGGSLSELLHQHKHIKYQACHVLNWALQVCEALSYLHAHSFIHRDIKPSNMLLSRDYKTLKLCDFGTVAELRTSMTDNRGTAAWMAPEVFRGKKYGQSCDIFSLGISLWEMIARKQPFTELNELNPLTLLWKVAENGLRPPKIEDSPVPLMELIERCWSNNPDDRPCLEEVQKTIEAFIEIFPNADLLPLVDRTTARQAFADSAWDNFQYNNSNIRPPPSVPAPIMPVPISMPMPISMPVQNAPPPQQQHYPHPPPPAPPSISVQPARTPPMPPASPNRSPSRVHQIIVQHHQSHRRRGSHDERLLDVPVHPFQQLMLHSNTAPTSHSMGDLSRLPSTIANNPSSYQQQQQQYYYNNNQNLQQQQHQPRFYQPNTSVSSSSNGGAPYNPCLRSPVHVAPENYYQQQQNFSTVANGRYSPQLQPMYPPPLICRTISEPPPDMMEQMESMGTIMTPEKKRKKSHLTKLWRGLRRF